MSLLRSTFKVLFHPIFIFVTSQIVWISIAILWVHWFVNAREVIEVMRSSLPLAIESHITITALVVGCILLGMLLVGSIWIFVVSQRQTVSLRQQQAFVSSVTHELRSPLASLKLMIETAETRRLSHDLQSQMLSMAKIDIERLLRLVNQVLLSSRLDRGVEDFSKTAEILNLKTILIQSTERAAWLDPTIQERVEMKCDDDIIVRASINALILIFGNIIENAVKYSPAGSPIKISVEKNHTSIKTTITDQGFGIRSQDMKRIFRLFQRGNVAISKALPGTGVGLFLVKSVTKILGGKVEVSSLGEGFGSSFLVEIPWKGSLHE
ncbi:MAG: ATP-binding protein [Pseudomonadota bacterium]